MNVAAKLRAQGIQVETVADILGDTPSNDDKPLFRQVTPHVRHYTSLIQGSDEWHQLRCGLLTASEMKLILTPTLKMASNDKDRAHLYELLAQRITGYVEPHYVSDDMLRGHEDEVEACILYGQKFVPVDNIGFITNDSWGFTLGYSPDGLVGKNGLIECKSRRQKYQIQTIVENVGGETVPVDFLVQCQSGLLISEPDREWLDFISYSGGLPMAIVRVWPDPVVQNAIVEAAGAFEARIAQKLEQYRDIVAAHGLIPTERKIYEEITL